MAVSQNGSFALTDTTVQVGKQCTLYGITFDMKGALLPTKSGIVLDSMVVFMQKNKQCVLEIGVHSDARTNPEWSFGPTQSRADTIVAYLIEQGIREQRLKAKGYGELQPIISEKQILAETSEEMREMMHARNRRVTLLVIDN